MKNALSSIAIVALLVALGALTLAAMPRGMETTATASAPAIQPAVSIEAAAPEAAENYNALGMPLDSSQQFADEGLTYDADGLAGLVGPGVSQVLRWDAASQQFQTWFPLFGDGVNFPLQTGEAYWLLGDSTIPTVVSFVGDVPAQGSIQFSLVGGSPCEYNNITVPLDQSGIINADQLSTAIGDVEQALRWNATTQQYETWFADFGDGVNFSVQIGYPYFLCMKTSKTWP